MRLTYAAVLRWVESDAVQCDPTELKVLADALSLALSESSRRYLARPAILENMRKLAAEAGLDWDAMEAVATKFSAPRGPETNDEKTIQFRRIHVNPYSTGTHADIHSIAPNRPGFAAPAWFTRARAAGFELDDLRYDKIAARAAELGVPMSFDPVELHRSAKEAAQADTSRKSRGKS